MISVATKDGMGADFKRFLHLIQELSTGFDGLLTLEPEASNETLLKACIIRFSNEGV